MMALFALIGMYGLIQGAVGASIIAFAMVPTVRWLDQQIVKRMAKQKEEG